ncbi:MAG: bstEII [Candidatus Edwardsbacteria bacterium]|nr:bstEII [Candidatus Edwardsbacteria bacterium]MBU1576456.1 bstEII [Candidatus Edwardsbacteria bacterium]MBU2464485.1 bstEII [Candidatus Edwardsbacteria bacterium]MBU2594529.1 bstEII [Candidatus Edwardsbacteria bacterium]
MKKVLTNTFSNYKKDASNWITLAGGEYYPDILKDACQLYKPVLVLFGQLVKSSESSSRLFLEIADVVEPWMRVQLLRVFKRYVCPVLPVEMTKRKTKATMFDREFKSKFRPINEVQRAFNSRPIKDEALCALLWEYKDRGKKGYDLTERFFELFRSNFRGLQIIGPERAGRDILMKEVFESYPNPTRPVDFVIKDKNKILAIGLARYDSDRGGAQEDDRTGGYSNCANEFLGFAKKNKLNTKLIFVNDGPGLLLGSMWNDYSALEKSWKGKIMVLTLRMVAERITEEWLNSKL